MSGLEPSRKFEENIELEHALPQLERDAGALVEMDSVGETPGNATKPEAEPGDQFNTPDWFTQLGLKFQEAAVECAEQLTHKQEYFHNSRYRWDRYFLGYASCDVDDLPAVQEPQPNTGSAARADLIGGRTRPSKFSCFPNFAATRENASGFAAFAFSHALAVAADQSDNGNKGTNRAPKVVTDGEEGDHETPADSDVGSELNVRAASIGLSADCLLRNYYSAPFMIQLRPNDDFFGISLRSPQQTALNYWRLLKSSLTSSSTSSTDAAAPNLASPPGTDESPSVTRRRKSSAPQVSHPVAGRNYKRPESMTVGERRRASERLAVWFASHELVGIFCRNHSLLGQLLILQYEARTRIALAAKMEREVMDQDALSKLSLSTYLDIMRLGPIFAGFEYPIFGTYVLSTQTWCSLTEPLSGEEESKLRAIIRDVGEFIVIRRQYYDVFGEGLLIRNGRLTWPLAVAVGQADEEQLSILKNNYGFWRLDDNTEPYSSGGFLLEDLDADRFGEGDQIPRIFRRSTSADVPMTPTSTAGRRSSRSTAPGSASAVARVRRVLKEIGVPEKFREWERAARSHSLAEIDAAVAYLEPKAVHALKIFFEEPFLAMTT